MLKLVLTGILSIVLSSVYSQHSVIKGVISDKATKETLVGATVLVQGTTIGAATDLDGNYSITNISPGIYNLVVSYISYKTQVIEKVKVTAKETVEVNILLEENSMALEGVVISAARRTGTDISMISSMKSANLVVSGISSQQIQRSQDRDASEVIRRVPGITIMDDRFVMVRGLNQRYNAVWLNNTTTPSSEPDIRAFSFDAIPSSMIENILVFKSASPDLPADFSGAAIKISTKNNPDENSFSVSYANAFRQGSTFRDFKAYNMGNLQWLGFDDGGRELPGNFPSHLNKLSDKAELQKLGRELNNVWSPNSSVAIPDQRFQLNIARRFLLGKASTGFINSFNYSISNDIDKVFRADYQQYDTVNDVSDTNYFFNDLRYRTTSKLGVLSNWIIVFGKNQKIEFRNLYNHIGYSQVLDRNGRDNYGGITIRATELGFNSRNTYSGQLAGVHEFNQRLTNLSWTIGYSYADRNQPDLKRITMALVEDPDNQYYGQYGVNFSFAATPEFSGRVYQKLKENIYIGSVNLSNTFEISDFKPELKVGIYYEMKDRSFNARNIGYAISNFSKFDWSLPYQPIEVIFSDTNINATTGIKIDESTNKSDSYAASNKLLASYIALRLPLLRNMEIFGGIRMENNIQSINSFSSDNASEEVNVSIDELKFFPSANLTYNFSKKSLVRASYGITINRPEFREIAPFAFFDFELKKLVRGNPSLTNASIQNYDFRYEYYPSPSEAFVAGIFYKDFKNPIEVIEINSGSGKDFTFQNSLGAVNYGIEFEVRKSLQTLDNQTNFLKYFKNFMLVANASLIRSTIRVDTSKFYSAQSERPMQGQSPYIVNLGVYYQNDKNGLMVSVLYNVIGQRILVVGLDTPDVYEMPRNVVDLTITKTLGKNFQLKAGIQDLFNSKVVEKQFVEFKNSNGELQSRSQSTLEFNPGSIITVGASLNL